MNVRAFRLDMRRPRPFAGKHAAAIAASGMLPANPANPAN
jgi:hypothetical protein